MAEHDHLLLTGFSFCLEKSAAEKRLEWQCGEERRRDPLAYNQFGLAAAGDREAAASHSSHVFEKLALLAPDQEFAGGKRHQFFLGQILPKHDEPICLRKWWAFQ